MDFNRIFDKIEDNAAHQIQTDTGDYMGDDGLLICGQCNTPKQCRVELFGRIRTPYCLCKCQVDKRDAEDAEIKRQERERRINKMRKMGFPDAEMQRCNFDLDDNQNPKITNAAKKYVENFKEIKKRGSGLLLFGNVGSGKTFMAACIANALIDRGYPCLVTNFARLTNTISGMYDGKQAYIDGLNKFDLLVIDDLGAERETEYMGEIVHNIIDSRYRANLPLIITTNLSQNDLQNPSDVRKQRIYSRLFEMCIPIFMPGSDRRLEKSQNEYNYMKNILDI